MAVILAATVGGCFIAGLMLIWHGRRNDSLAVLVAELDRPVQQYTLDRRQQIGGRFGVANVTRSTTLTQLRILDKTPEQHAYEKLIALVAGFAVPVLFGIALTLADVSVNWIWVAIASIVLAAIGFWYPDLPLTEQVKQRQTEFRSALSAYLDLVSIFVAGGAGPEAALQHAADTGGGWAFGELRAALRRAKISGQTPWAALGELGDELDVRELRDLAATISVAGAHGGKIRESLTAKADAMRYAEAAHIEADEERRSEQMVVPTSFMVLGLVLFVGYGALQAITSPGDQQQQVQQVKVEQP